jgi:hypothetical protein
MRNACEDMEKSHTALSTVLRSVASTEPNNVLQYITFLYAQKEEMLCKEQQEYRGLVDEINDMLDSSCKLVIAPIRVGRAAVALRLIQVCMSSTFGRR